MIQASPQSEFRPAAEAMLAAAGPVEPSASPDLAPGPTLHKEARKTHADYFGGRRTQSLVNQVRALYRRGETFSSIARALAITPDTARRWLDPEYDCLRRHNRFTPSPSHVSDSSMDADMFPTLPFIPGITISGRYRMKRPGM
jgi:hypothetical protein